MTGTYRQVSVAVASGQLECQAQQCRQVRQHNVPLLHGGVLMLQQLHRRTQQRSDAPIHLHFIGWTSSKQRSWLGVSLGSLHTQQERGCSKARLTIGH